MSLTSLASRPNVILFDDDSGLARHNSTGGLVRAPEVQNALNDLNKRILKIQIYEQVLRDKAHSLESKGSNQTVQSPTDAHHDQILNVLEKKLHMLIMESSKALEDLKEEIERVMTREIMDKKVSDYEIRAISERLESSYTQKLRELETAHSEELLKLQKSNQSIERAFGQRLERVQNKLLQRIRDLERKEESYKAQISNMRSDTADTKKIQQLEKELQKTKVALKALPEKTSREGVSVTKYESNLQKDTTSRLRRNRIFQRRQEQMPSVMVSPIRKQYSQVASVNILTRQLEHMTSEMNLDFNHHEQGSDEDVFFYPQTTKVHYASDLQSNASTTKISSPFDIDNKY